MAWGTNLVPPRDPLSVLYQAAGLVGFQRVFGVFSEAVKVDELSAPLRTPMFAASVHRLARKNCHYLFLRGSGPMGSLPHDRGQFGELAADGTKNVFPVAGRLLAKYSHGWVPRTVRPIGHPAPIGKAR